MIEHRALILYEGIIRGFQSQMDIPKGDIVEILEAGFGFLSSRLSLDGIDLFRWDAEKSSFNLQYSYRDGVLMEGEEELPVKPQSELWDLVRTCAPVVISPKKPWLAYIPLCSHKELLGALRIERPRKLPQGNVLIPLPRFHANKEGTPNPFPLLSDLGDILTTKLGGVSRELHHARRAQYLKAGSEVAAAVVETPRLKEMLERVAQSIVKNLGFDRIRFYLVDPSRSELKGIIGLQIPDRVLNLEGEKHPLKSGHNSLVDAVLEAKNEAKLVSAGGMVNYFPLVVGGQVIGCMAVDNLLSQAMVDEEQMGTLRSLAGQIGMAVLNARLFEDIEQQAITDGLTKLYVYRYFQQRLKEEIDRADRYSYSMALVMMDVDNFKTFNDTYGHTLGDKVLEFLAQSIRGNIRRIDLAARYGGDEFILLLPEITEQEAWLMGTRLLNALRESTLNTDSGEKLSVQVTMGVSMYPSDAQTSRDLMERADRALYWGKKNRRGDICLYRTISGKAEKTA